MSGMETATRWCFYCGAPFPPPINPEKETLNEYGIPPWHRCCALRGHLTGAQWNQDGTWIKRCLRCNTTLKVLNPT